MAELYDNARQANSTYVPQFVGSNFDTLKQTADTLDARYRANRELSDKVAIAMANDKYHEADQHIGDKHYNSFKDLIHTVASSDQNFENSSGIISNAVRDYATDRHRIAALDNYKKHEEYLNKKSELGAEGEDFTKAFTGTLNTDGSINRFRAQLEKKLDHDKRKESYFNQIDQDIKQGKYTQDELNQEFLKSTITGGISDTKIGNYVKEAILRHKTTPEYDQEKRAYIRDGLTPQQADDAINRSILATGLERYTTISKEDLQRHSERYMARLYGDDVTPEAKKGYEETSGKDRTPVLLPKDKLNKIGEPTGFIHRANNHRANNIHYNEKTGLTTMTTGNRETIIGRGEEGKKMYEDAQEEKRQALAKAGVYVGHYPEMTEEEQKKFTRIAKHFNKDVDPQSEEAYNIVRNYVAEQEKQEQKDNTNIITSGWNELDQKGKSRRDASLSDLKTNYMSRVFYDPKTGETYSGSDPKFLEQMGFSDTKSKTAHQQFTDALNFRGEYSPKNFFTSVGNNPNLVDPLAISVNGRDLAVTRAKDHYDGKLNSDFSTHKLIHDAYKAIKETPGIENDVVLGGIPFVAKEMDDPQKGHVFVFESKIGSNAKTIEVTDLEDLPRALYEAFNKK